MCWVRGGCSDKFVDLHIGAALPEYVQNGCTVCIHNILLDSCAKCNQAEEQQELTLKNMSLTDLEC